MTEVQRVRGSVVQAGLETPKHRHSFGPLARSSSVLGSPWLWGGSPPLAVHGYVVPGIPAVLNRRTSDLRYLWLSQAD